VITVSFDNIEAPLLSSSNQIGNNWYHDGIFIENATGMSHTVQFEGTYTVQTIVDDCVSELSEGVAIILTDISMENHNEIKVWPNPASDFIYLDGVSENAKFTLFLPDGHKLNTQTSFSENKFRVDISCIASGYYLLQIVDRDHSHTVRFVKK
jgi:hypothetical protein